MATPLSPIGGVIKSARDVLAQWTDRAVPSSPTLDETRRAHPPGA